MCLLLGHYYHQWARPPVVNDDLEHLPQWVLGFHVNYMLRTQYMAHRRNLVDINFVIAKFKELNFIQIFEICIWTMQYKAK